MGTHMLKSLALGGLFSLVFASGCDKTGHGECSTDADMHWFKRTQVGPMGTNKWCVVCDSTVSLEDADLWVEDNAGESFLSWEDWRTEGVTPCLYVYSSGDEDFADAAVCEAAACAPDPEVNDPVYDNHGMWDYIEPILFGG